MSPTKGYRLTGFMEQFIPDISGLAREIAIGFDKFKSPSENFRIYHHKTVTDEVLTQICGDFEDFCNPLNVQNNNLDGSQEFYYPEQTHESIMLHVISKISACRI